MVEKLTKEEQITVVKAVRDRVESFNSFLYLCPLMHRHIYLVGHAQYRYIEDCMPLFTKECAIEICIKHNILGPNDGGMGWWNFPDDKKKMKKVRLDFMNALIKEIEKQ